MKIMKVCEKCGSEDVWIDASAEWNTYTQSWELGNKWGYSYCADCDAETNILNQEDAETDHANI